MKIKSTIIMLGIIITLTLILAISDSACTNNKSNNKIIRAELDSIRLVINSQQSDFISTALFDISVKNEGNDTSILFVRNPAEQENSLSFFTIAQYGKESDSKIRTSFFLPRKNDKLSNNLYVSKRFFSDTVTIMPHANKHIRLYRKIYPVDNEDSTKLLTYLKQSVINYKCLIPYKKLKATYPQANIIINFQTKMLKLGK